VPTADRLRFAALPAAFVAVLTASVAQAQSAPPDGLRYDLRVDIPITAGAVALGVTLELLKRDLGPRSCRVCGVDGLDVAARGALLWDDADAARTLSDWTGFVAAPITALATCQVAAAADHHFHDAPANALVAVEATALAVALDDVVKLIVGRQRPMAHFRDSNQEAPPDAEDNLSFYSGHTNLAFVVAVASGTIASMRGYRLAPVVWATSLPWAAVTGYLRIAADRHYLTDVLTGALVGSAVGFLVPFVFHRASAATTDTGATSATLVAQARGPFVATSWTF
jgi:membrane-associated phospholipid phosphatase